MWNSHPYRCIDRYQLPEGSLHHHRISQVNEVYRHRMFLTPHGDVNHARTVYRNDGFFRKGPPYCIAEQLSVILTHYLPECTVNVRRKIGDPAFSDLAEEKS